MDIPISSQLVNFIRWAIAFSLVYMVLPAILFPISGVSVLERLFSRYIRMVALTIIVGYILIAVKLYEVLSLLFVFAVLGILVKIPANNRRQTLQRMKDDFLLAIYDFLDGLRNPYQLFRRNLDQKLFKLKLRFKRKLDLPNTIQWLLLLCVLGYSAYLRFYDTFKHAAPAMSDAYVTLAWMKYIDDRILFHDGIYPQGFHIYLSILHKFAACDALYILKYTGPFNGVLTVIGIYFFVGKIAGRKLPGIISAFVFGVLACTLSYEWLRQAATNSQEFAMVFLFPAWYYSISFLQTQNSEYLWTAAASFAVIGFVHTLIFAFLWVGLACLVCAYLLLDFRQRIGRAAKLIAAGILAGLLASLPVPIALLAGKSFNSSSVDFLTSKIQMGIPDLKIMDKFSILGFGLFFLITVLNRKNITDLAMSLYIISLGVASFLMYLLLGPMTGNAVLVTRIGILWSLLTAVGVGLGAETFLRLIPLNQSTQSLVYIVSIIASAIMLWSVTYIKPEPARPYKMQYDAEINQYLRITREYIPSEWTVVSPQEGYDLVLGKGWHIQLHDFLSWYNPIQEKLTRNVDGKVEKLDTKDLFIFCQKRLFKVDMKEMEPVLAERAKDYAALRIWIKKYKENHDDLTVYYQDDDIEIYHIHQPKSKADSFKEIWGPN